MGGSRIIHLRLIISLVMLVQTKLSSETPWSDNSESPFHNRIENGQSLTPVKPCRLHKILSDLFIHDLLKYDSQYLLDLYTRILVGDDSIRTSDKFFHNCAGVLNEFEYQLLLKQLKTRDSSNWLKLRPWYQNVCHLSQSHGKSNEKREDVIPVTLYFAGFILAGKLAINPHDVCHVQKAIGLLIGIINLIRRLICSLKKLEDFLTSVICGSHSSITESDWMYDPNGPPHCNIDYVVFPAFGRLATYRPLYSAETPNSVPYIQLAEAGFEYRNEEFLVQCHECQRKVELGSLTSDPMQSQYHEKGCSHVQASLAPTDLADKENRGSWDSDSDGGFDESDEIETDCPEPVPDQNVQVTNDAYYMRESTENDKTTPSSSSARPITYTVSSDINNLTQSTNAWSPSVDASRQQPPTTVASNEMARRNPEHLNGNISHSIQSSHSSSYSAAPKDTSSSASMCGATDGSSSSTLQDEADEGVDADMGSFEPEAVIDCDRFDNVAAVISIDCKKNKGHYAYFPIRQLQLKHIPSSVRCQEVLKFLKLAASLTVRIVVSATSKKRRSDDPARSVRIRIGTGSCFENDASIGRNDYDGEQGGKWNTVRRLMQLGKRQKMGKIYVETNRHIVFNEEEAENTVVEFFYDHPNRKEIVRVKGVSIQHSRVLGDYKSVLICKTSNLDLVERVNQAREEMKTLVKGFPQAVKEGLQRRIFIISHPHGGEKVLSYGDSVMIKYALTSERRGDKTVHSMVKLNNSQQVTQQSSNVRKVLLYTADTCQGSSGAPVITFQATSTGDSSGNEAGADGGHEVIEMDMWMHNGVDIKHSLGGSVMKELTAEDIANHGKPTRTRSSVQDNMNRNTGGDGQSSYTQIPSCPVFTVVGHPSYPAYVSFQSRLDSFAQWQYHHFHLPVHLAEAGFFYAGYADCVRCFQCGLGLRSWKEGDDVYVEHYKHRPNCQFLQMKLRVRGIDNPETQLRSQTRQNDSEPGEHRIHSFIFSSQAALSSASSATQLYSNNTQQPNFSSRNGLGGTDNGGSHNSKLAMVVQQTPVSASEEAGQSGETCRPALNSVSASTSYTTDSVAEERTLRTSERQILSDAASCSGAATADKNLKLTVLERENRILQQQLTCKVCCQKPIKDLFLPCGDLFACTECSKLLTHCPACNEQILATVTTYFT